MSQWHNVGCSFLQAGGHRLHLILLVEHPVNMMYGRKQGKLLPLLAGLRGYRTWTPVCNHQTVQILWLSNSLPAGWRQLQV